MIKVTHRKCGAQIGWYKGIKGMQVRAADFIRMDGSSPKPNDRVREKCIGCGDVITSLYDFDMVKEDD